MRIFTEATLCWWSLLLAITHGFDIPDDKDLSPVDSSGFQLCEDLLSGMMIPCNATNTSVPVDGFYNEPPPPPAFQSGPDLGPSYAGGMSYDAYTDTIYITGQTFGNLGGAGYGMSQEHGSCFVAALAGWDLSIQQVNLFGTADSAEACSTIKLLQFPSDPAVEARVIGVAETGGFLSEMVSKVDNLPYGLVLGVEVNGLNFDKGAVLDRGKAEFPTAVEIDSTTMNTFVVGVEVDELFSRKRHLADDQDDDFPNWTRGGFDQVQKSGKVQLEKFNENMELAFSVSVNILGGASYPSGVIKTINGTVVVVGTTTPPDSATGSTSGFMALVDEQKGSLLGPATLVTETSGKDVTITHICPSPNEQDHFYVVGGTTGIVSTNADYVKPGDMTIMEPFVAKYSVGSMSKVWIAQLPVTEDSHRKPKGGKTAGIALGCDVIKGDHFMYIVGAAQDGAAVGSYADGSNDIFVTQLDTDTGFVTWTKQLGVRHRRMSLARGGGVVATMDGHAVVFGETDAELFPSTTSGDQSMPMSTSVFLMVFMKEVGSYQYPFVVYEDGDDGDDLEFLNTVVAIIVFGTSTAVCLAVSLCAFFVIYKLSRQIHNKSSTRGVRGGSYDQVSTFEDKAVTDPVLATSETATLDDVDDDTSVASGTSLSRNL